MFEKYKNLIKEFVTLSQQEWELFESKLKVVKYKKGDILLHAGDICKTLRFINKGIARLYFINEEGKEFTCFIAYNDANARPTDKFILDFESYSKQTKSGSFSDVVEDCEIIEVSYEDMQELCSKIKNLEIFMNEMATLVFSSIRDDMIYRSTTTAKQRYEDFLHDKPILLKKVPQHQLATFLGIAPQSLSRLKNESN